jgi:phosphatidylglycerol:prolipoprotein diacylglycerol transferase
LSLAQAIGRWGNFVNQELYGQPTELPWGIYIAPEYRVPGFEQFEHFHPTFLYESLLNLMICGVLLWIVRRFAQQLKPGDVFLLYLIFYSMVRFGMEMLRLDSSGLGGLNINQTLSVVVAFASSIWLVIHHPSRAHTPRPAPDRS